MSFLAVMFVLGGVMALFVVPRRWAPLPLLLGCCYMTLEQGITLGPFNFSVIRLLLAAGFVRVLVKGERPVGGLNGMDRILIAFSIWALISSQFHDPPASTLINRLGLVYNVSGVYFLIRCFCCSLQDLVGIIKAIAIILLPVALEMVFEQATARNLFGEVFGGALEPSMRNGRLRAQGPFAHSILAGTIGAACVPLMAGIWREHPRAAKIGMAACLVMVLSSASSGPLMSLMLAVFALAFWRWRHLARRLWILAMVGYVVLDLVMEAPAYYIIARFDLVGGSTGWYRARLIQSALRHLNEWWFAGTDYTRHWMAHAVPGNPNQVDITNHYLKMGVLGGLPLMFLFIALMWFAFRYVGNYLRAHQNARVEDQYLIWALGASLFAHAATCFSVSYFDQSFVFLYMTFGLAGSLRAMANPLLESATATDPQTDEWSIPSSSSPNLAGIPSYDFQSETDHGRRHISRSFGLQ